MKDEYDWNERIKTMRLPELRQAYGCPLCSKQGILGLLEEPDTTEDPNTRLKCTQCSYKIYWKQPAHTT